MRFVMIGGFLGAGKTTTIGKLAKLYQSQGLNPPQVIGKLAAGLNLVSKNSELSLLELLSELKNNKRKLLNVFNNAKG